jgi:hypothetical protein
MGFDEMIRFCSGSFFFDPTDPASGQWTILESFSTTDPVNPGTGNRTIHCGDQPDDCVVAAMLTSTNQFVAVAPIDVTPSPFVVSSVETLGDGSPFTVWLGGDPGAGRTVAQCASRIGTDRAGSRCALDQTVTLDGRGAATLTFPNQPTMTVGGETVDCLAVNCVLALFDGSGALLSTRNLAGSPPLWELHVSPDTDVPDGSTVTVSADTVPAVNGPLLVGQCLASAAQPPNDLVTKCRIAGQLDGPPPWHVDVQVFRTFTSVNGATQSCDREPGGCLIGIANIFGGPPSPGAKNVAVPFSFGPLPTASLSPAAGLVDGQSMRLDAAHLTVGATYQVVHCSNSAVGSVGLCEPAGSAPTVVASPTGTVSTTVPALQRLDSLGTAYCRARCQVGLMNTRGRLEAVAGYAMAPGSISASPSEGLHDGQTVTVTGDHLMTSYAGRTFWIFSTGQWAVGECDAAVASDPTVPGIFTHCTLPPPGGPVTISAPDTSTPFPVTATLHPVTGATVDCTTGPGACVIGLFRIEQDLTLTLHTTPISFTASP